MWYFRVISDLLENSSRNLKLILAKILSSPAPKEGEVLTLTLMAKLIREQCGDKINEIIHKICLIINSDRFSHQKRIYAIYLSGIYSMMICSGDDP
jgi:hypothetical protein